METLPELNPENLEGHYDSDVVKQEATEHTSVLPTTYLPLHKHASESELRKETPEQYDLEQQKTIGRIGREILELPKQFPDPLFVNYFERIFTERENATVALAQLQGEREQIKHLDVASTKKLLRLDHLIAQTKEKLARLNEFDAIERADTNLMKTEGMQALERLLQQLETLNKVRTAAKNNFKLN